MARLFARITNTNTKPKPRQGGESVTIKKQGESKTMLNKENTKKAERIAEELKPVFYRAYELGAIYDNTRERLQKASNIKNAYYFTNRHYCAAAGLDFDTIQAMKNSTDPATVEKWSKLYNKSLREETRAEDAHTVAAFNFKNYVDYFAALIADYIRPHWHEFAQRGGLSTLADIINRNATKDHTAGAVSVSICLDRGEFDPKNPTAPGAFVRVSVTICPGWACGVSGYIGKYYQNNPGEVWHSAELPPVLTVEKYKAAKIKLHGYYKKAEQLRAECVAFAKSCGLLGRVPILAEPTKTI